MWNVQRQRIKICESKRCREIMGMLSDIDRKNKLMR